MRPTVRHMTIGEWLTETVIRAADRDLGEGEPETGQANLPATTDRTPELAGALGALVQHLEKGGNEGALATRIDRTEAVLTGRMEQIAAAMYGVMQTVERNAAKPVEIDHRATGHRRGTGAPGRADGGHGLGRRAPPGTDGRDRRSPDHAGDQGGGTPTRAGAGTRGQLRLHLPPNPSP